MTETHKARAPEPPFTRRSAKRPCILVIGIGNEFRGDDGIGARLAHKLKAKLPSDVEMLVQTAPGTELLEIWNHAHLVVLLDAFASGDAPGTFRRVEVVTHELPRDFCRTSTHALGLSQLLELARALHRLPPRLLVYGIVGRSFLPGRGLSPEVQKTMDQAAALIRREILTIRAAVLRHIKHRD